MKHLLGNLALCATLLGAVPVGAHSAKQSDPVKALHGGQSLSAGPYHLELVAQDGQLLLYATDTMLMEARRTLLERMGIPVGLQDRQLRGRVPVNDLHRCSCEVRHVSLRHLQYGRDPEEDQNFAERVTEIKTKFWIGKDEQDDLYRAVRVVMKKLDEQRLFAEESLKPQCMSEETDGH